MAQYDLIDDEYDWIDAAAEDARTYRREFLLWKTQWGNYPDPIPLNWKCVRFEKDNRSQIPSRKGIYAFFVEPRIANFPSHGYLMYIGQTGQDSNHNLRKRFGDYLGKSEGKKRPSIKYMLTKWKGYLYFYYAEIDPDQINLEQLERTLLDTFTPPFVKKGFSGKIKSAVDLSRN
jgi:hypothetical protein